MDFQAKYIIATSWVKYDGLRYSRRSVLASFFPLLASFTAQLEELHSHGGPPHVCKFVVNYVYL